MRHEDTLSERDPQSRVPRRLGPGTREAGAGWRSPTHLLRRRSVRHAAWITVVTALIALGSFLFS